MDDTTRCTKKRGVSNSAVTTIIAQIESRSVANLMQLHPKKCKELTVSFLKSFTAPPEIVDNIVDIKRVESVKVLGVVLQNNLKWDCHVDAMVKKARKRIFFMKKKVKEKLLKWSGLPAKDILQIYNSIIRSVLEYACPVWHSQLTALHTAQIQHVQNIEID